MRRVQADDVLCELEHALAQLAYFDNPAEVVRRILIYINIQTQTPSTNASSTSGPLVVHTYTALYKRSARAVSCRQDTAGWA